jgi:acetyltransferase-like isoleucine patch superfamily enzyme/coenzyme F420-reducing hydrogenase beta subunit
MGSFDLERKGRNDMLEKMMYSENCTGCKMCGDLCPVHAISFIEDKGGFFYPKVDEKICIKCGLCEKTCPGINGYESKKEKPVVYAAWTKDKEQRLACTSGGVCYELSKTVIEQGGYVAGVEYAEDFKSAHYTVVHDMEGLKRITETKYFQADANGVYARVKELLDAEKQVLFIGTPCYNAALDSYLGKEYANLIQCDFVCRGNPSPRQHAKMVEYLEEMMGSRVVGTKGKDKRKGWECFGRSFQFENGKEWYRDRWHSPTYFLFSAKNINERDCCYHCHYRSVPRVPDITVGDFWGVQDVKKEEFKYGISLLMINSEKGKQLFEQTKDKIEFQEKTFTSVEKGNYALYCNPEKPPVREEFFEDLNKMSFGDIIKKYVQKYMGNPKWKNIERKIKKAVKLIPKVSWGKFIHYNFFCNKVIRKKGKWLIPYRGSCIVIRKGGRIILEGNMHINARRIRGSKAETIIKIQKDGVLKVKEKLMLNSRSTIQVESGAYLEIGDMATNVNCNITCNHSITIGYGVMLGRDITIYDSNYHPTGGKVKSRPVVIGNHVWIGTGAMIMMGTKIGDGSMIGAKSYVTGKVKPNSLLMPEPAKLISRKADWKK